MFIAIRKEPNGTLYIDKDIYSRTQEVQDENGNITIQPLFSDETLSQPPYNYTKVDIDDKYADCIHLDFDYTDDTFVFNLAKYNKRKNIKLASAEIAELKTWFDTIYTKQEQKLRRLITLKTLCDDGQRPEDKLITLYNEAERKRKRIQELEAILID